MKQGHQARPESKTL